MREDGPVHVKIPHLPPAALGLGLCDVRKVFTGEQLTELDRDLAAIARNGRQAPPNDVRVD